MSIFFAFELLILGLFIGSFLNVLADRLPNERSILGRSHCDSCHKTLSWKDLVPVVSFLYLRGKCRYCHTTLSYQYPLVEIVTGFVFALTFLIVQGNIVSLIVSLCFVSCLIAIFFADLRYGIIPDEIIIFGIAVTTVWLIIFSEPLIINHFISALGAFGFFLLIFLATKGRGMGFGDVKLAFLLGLFLGFPGIALALYTAFLTGGLVGVILILWKKKKMRSTIAFGPFLVAGTFLSFFFSPILLPKILAFL